jgi:hypothetical protein
MVARGVHYALTNDQYEGLRAQPDDFSRIEYLTIEIGEPAVEAFLQDTDKAWDAIHRCLGDFPPDTPWFYPVDPEYGAYALPEDFGSYPLKLCILGGRKLMDDESLYFMRLIESHEVADVAEALKSVTEHWFAQSTGLNARVPGRSTARKISDTPGAGSSPFATSSFAWRRPADLLYSRRINRR